MNCAGILVWFLAPVAAVDWLYYPDLISPDAVARVFKYGGGGWLKSNSFCLDYLPGKSRQGRVRTSEMNDKITNQMLSLSCAAAWLYSQNQGTGSPYNEPKGDWCWADGTCYGYAGWRTGEPNDGGKKEHCAFAMTGSLLGLWNDGVCSTAWMDCVVCEIPSCPDGLVGNPFTKNCTSSCAPMKAYYVDENSYCRDCPAGRFSTAHMPTQCELCAPGKYSDVASEECQECEPGRYSNAETQGLCQLCPAGSGSTKGSSSCSSCEVGKYALSGTGCLPCEKGKYSDLQAASACTACVPQVVNQSLLFNMGSSDLEACTECFPGFFLDLNVPTCQECPEGKFRSPGMDSETCEHCPSGRFNAMNATSTCQECSEGKWSSIVGSSSQQTCKSCPELDGATCPQGSPVPFVSQGFFRSLSRPDDIKKCVPRDACLEAGYNSTVCKEGYQGDLCSQCVQSKYYRKGRECLRCGKQWPKWLFFAFIVVLLVSITFMASTPNEKFGDYIKIPMFGVQALVIIPRLTEDLDPTVATYLRMFSVVNLDLQFFSFDCDVRFSYWTTWILKLLMPLFIAITLLLLYSAAPWLQRKKLVKVKFPMSQYIYCFITLLQFLYLYMLVIVAEPLQCFRQSSGEYTMIAFPSLQCHSKEWKSYVYGFGVPMGIVYIVLIPLYFARLLWTFRANIQSDYFKKYYGCLTRSFRPEYYWYEGVVTLKKFGIVFLPDLLCSWISGNVRVLTCFVAMMFFLIVDSSFMPYSKPSMNNVNILFTTASVFVLMSSFVTASDSGASFGEKRMIVVFAILFMLYVKSYALSQFALRRFQPKSLKNAVAKADKQQHQASVVLGTVIVPSDLQVYSKESSTAPLAKPELSATI